MKNIVLGIIGAAMMVQGYSAIPVKTTDRQKTQDHKGSLVIMATPDLQNLATGWANEFAVANPEMKIKVVNSSDPGSMNTKKTGADLAFSSTDFAAGIRSGSEWKMVIGRDAIVPVVNASNPLFGEIMRQGISADEFSRLFENPETCSWAALLQGGKNIPANLYLMDDESSKKAIAGFVSREPGSITGHQLTGGAAVIAAVAKDPNGIGFCKLADFTALSKQNASLNVVFLPIDRNANGKMDYIEKIYGNVADLSRGIWIGKYPQSLCRNLYAIAPVKPTDENQVAFLKYILTGGQASLEANSLNSLANSERLSKIDQLPSTSILPQAAGTVNMTQLIITILAGLAIIFAILFLVIRYRRNTGRILRNIEARNIPSINENSLAAPKGLLFDKTHTWAFMETDGTVRIGLDDFMQHVTGRITSIKMKMPGEKIRKGDTLMTLVQRGKRLTINSPASGIILAENTTLINDPSLINSAPYNEGWIYRIEPTNWIRETQFLFMAEKYHEWLRNEISRLRDFLASVIKPSEPEYAYAILQDGGEIADNLLENLSPEVWEDFQTKFIDVSK